MHYFQHNIGDYRRDTMHLSMIEHGAYRQLIDQYYLDETPIPLDEAKVMRTHCARSAEEVQAIKNVLNDFFEKTENGYIHKRCDGEIEKFYAKSQKARESAKARWNKNKELPKEKEDNANAMQTHSEGNATHLPNNPSTQQPKDPEKDLKNKQKKSSPLKKILFSEFLKRCKENNENSIPENDGVFDIAKRSGVTSEMLRLCWLEFADKYSTDTKKKYVDWRRAFQNCVRDNWYDLWYADHEGNILLTSKGRLAQNRQEAA